MLHSEIEARVNELDEPLELSLSEIFHIVSAEFNLDAASISSDLGCECPFGLIGYLAACND